jgi:ribonucleoside-triphosphate reductase
VSGGGHQFTIANKSLWEDLIKLGNSKEKHIPDYAWECSIRQLNILYKSLMLGDGHKRHINGSELETHAYYTVSPRLSDDIQHLMMRLGYSSTKSIRPPRVSKIKERTIKSENNQYTILRLNSYGTGLKKNSIEIEHYEGKVYCVEVPNHIIFVRRHGRTVWCGNSVGVVTINMPKIGYLSKTKEEFYERLDKLMDIAAESLDAKRKFVEKMLDMKMFPYTKRYLGHFNNHFSTIGLIGMNECCLNFMNKTIADPEAQAFSIEVMQHMKERLSDYQEKTGALFNLEATPGEGTSYRFARHDKANFKDIITAGTQASPYYTNSTNLPVDYTGDVWEAITHQEPLQNEYTGGCVFHTFLSESVNDPEKVAEYIKKVFVNTKLPYLTLSPTIVVCANSKHGFLLNNDGSNVCPYCKEEQIQELKKAKERLAKKKKELLEGSPSN